MKEMRWLRMRWRDCVLCGCVEPSFVPRVESSCGVVWVADWLEAAFCAWARDAAKVVDVGDLSAKAKADLIVPELTEELLHHLLRAWYRLSVYQQQLSRSSLPHPSSPLPHAPLPRPAPQRGHLRPRSRPAGAVPTRHRSGGAGAGAGSSIDSRHCGAATRHEGRSVHSHRSHQSGVRAGAQCRGSSAAPEAGREDSEGAAGGWGHQRSGVCRRRSVPHTHPRRAGGGAEGTGGGRPSGDSPPALLHPVCVSRTSLAVSSSSLPPAVPASPPSPTPATFTAAFASLSCPVCGECFSTDLHSYHHVSNEHHLALCTLCALAFDSEELLYAHFETHNHAAESADAPHACGLCGVSFHSEEGLTLHHSVHLIERKAKQQYSKRKKRKTIAEERTASPSKKAKKGGEEEDEEGGGDDDDGDGGGGGGPNRFPPAICSHPAHPTPLCFSSDEDLHAHSIAAHVSYQCFANDCDSTFTSASLLAEHIVRLHVLTSREHIPGGPVPPHCPYCGVVWTKKTPRTEHLHRHEKPFHCPKCGMRFARRTRWRNHVKRKHPDDFKRHSAIFEGAKG